MKNNTDSLVYKFYIGDECVYVGITNNAKIRFNQHKQVKPWFKDITKIEVTEHMNRNEAHIYEIYYISILKPKYNDDFMKYTDGFNLNLEDIEFKKYKPNTIKLTEDEILKENYLRRKSEIMEMEDCSYRQIELNNSYIVSPFFRRDVFDEIGCLNGTLSCLTLVNFLCQIKTSFNYKDKDDRYIYVMDEQALNAHVTQKQLKKIKSIGFLKNITKNSVDSEVLSNLIRQHGNKNLKSYWTITDFRKGDIDKAKEILSIKES